MTATTQAMHGNRSAVDVRARLFSLRRRVLLEPKAAGPGTRGLCPSDFDPSPSFFPPWQRQTLLFFPSNPPPPESSRDTSSFLASPSLTFLSSTPPSASAPHSHRTRSLNKPAPSSGLDVAHPELSGSYSSGLRPDQSTRKYEIGALTRTPCGNHAGRGCFARVRRPRRARRPTWPPPSASPRPDGLRRALIDRRRAAARRDRCCRGSVHPSCSRCRRVRARARGSRAAKEGPLSRPGRLVLCWLCS